jgi:hypothetical protein
MASEKEAKDSSEQQVNFTKTMHVIVLIVIVHAEPVLISFLPSLSLQYDHASRFQARPSLSLLGAF